MRIQPMILVRLLLPMAIILMQQMLYRIVLEMEHLISREDFRLLQDGLIQPLAVMVGIGM